MLKVLICGFGSIGKRHIRIIEELTDVELIRYKSKKGRRLHHNKHDNITEVDSLEQGIKLKPDFALISNPTRYHVDTALKLSDAGIPFLLEKPVSNRIDDLVKLENALSRKKVTAMVGFQLRQHPGYSKTLELIKKGYIGRPYHASGYVGQYLPDWRPNTDYRSSYSAKKVLGGGVILDLCHEMDIIISILGQVKSVCCMADHISNLEIETEDFANIILNHENNAMSSIHLNYLERNYTWWTRITGETGSILWDYGNGWVKLYDMKGSVEKWTIPEEYTRDDLFRSQMKQWLSILEGKKEPAVDLKTGIEVARISIAALKSAESKKQIEV